MTATAVMLTGSGFAVAADGNQLWGHEPTRNATIRDNETDSAQKIYGIETGTTALAYIVRGDVANENRTFDVALDLMRDAAPAIKRWPTKPKAFVADIGNALERQIAAAVEAGRLKCWPFLQLSFLGFVGNDPFYVNLNFYHFPNSNGVHYDIIGQMVDGWAFTYSGSDIIGLMMLRSDARIRPSIKLPSERPSLQDAVDVTLGYVKACSSPLGLEVDPANCRGLGGHIHVATITPPRRPSWMARFMRGESPCGGFAWVVPPKNS